MSNKLIGALFGHVLIDIVAIEADLTHNAG